MLKGKMLSYYIKSLDRFCGLHHGRLIKAYI